MSHPLFEKSDYTIGGLCDAVLGIHDGAEARQFYEDYVAWAKEHADERYRTQEGAESLAKQNIGWIFGEGMPHEDIIMWLDACGAQHPVFGTGMLSVTPEQAFQAGLEQAQKP